MLTFVTTGVGLESAKVEAVVFIGIEALVEAEVEDVRVWLTAIPASSRSDGLIV